MHPLLATPRRFLLYVAAWLPIAALIAAVMWASSGIGWVSAAAALGPACLVYAFVCLSPWYICRTRPLGAARLPGLVVTWAGAAAAASLVLAALVWFSAAFARGSTERIRAQFPLLIGMGLLLYLLSAGLHYAALATEASREAERRAAESSALAREAELAALRLQLNPHFLFNSLHSIAALATQDGVRAREMCIRLAAFLRSSLGAGGRESIPLREELALARSYLEVEQVRFGKRLRVEEQIGPGCEELEVPTLLLQPLVENAVKHGIAGLVEGGSIRLAAERRGPAVAITLENGFDPESPAPRKLGLGLAHVRRRLEIRYGRDAGLETGPCGAIYRVVLRLPCESPMAASSRA
jgi:two-component system, LytTR family, sensor histidine kinase AlgZ